MWSSDHAQRDVVCAEASIPGRASYPSSIGVTAIAVTVIAALGSVLIGALTAWLAEWRWIFLTIPVWLLARMALNAIDGMLAREFHQKSVLGGYLNEMGDVVSDAALYSPVRIRSAVRIDRHRCADHVVEHDRVRRRARREHGRVAAL